MTVTGVVFDPFAWNPKANAAKIGKHKAVRSEAHNGRVSFPYNGAASIGERVSFTYELPSRSHA